MVFHEHTDEVARFDTHFVVHEHGVGGFSVHRVDLRLKPENLMYHDAWDDARVYDCRPIVGVCPFGDGDHIAWVAHLQVLGVDVAGAFKGRVKNLTGGETQCAGDKQVFGIYRLFPAIVRAIDEQGLVILGSGESLGQRVERS